MGIGQIIVEGLLYGLALSIMLGPIFVALTQTGIEKGIRAGLIVGLGIWISDVIIILGLIYLMANISVIDLEGDFKFYSGIIGGLILIAFGIGSALKKVDFIEDKTVFSAKSISGYWLKGFLVNTVNPFTFIFWITLISNYLVVAKISKLEAIVFFTTIMLTIITTDSLKVIAAKAIRKKLSKDRVILLSKIAGFALAVFGIILIVRSTI